MKDKLVTYVAGKDGKEADRVEEETTEEQYDTDEKVGWALRALRDQQSQGIDVAVAESEVIATAFENIETLPPVRKAFWLGEFELSKIVKQ
jgi:hypothetical protein